jgi:hypothetical protein
MGVERKLGRLAYAPSRSSSLTPMISVIAGSQAGNRTLRCLSNTNFAYPYSNAGQLRSRSLIIATGRGQAIPNAGSS